jgi:two-component system sensor histidine kinase/response regulator
MKILVIEDDAAIRQTLVDLLELNGHTVLAAADGDEGIRRAGEHPELVLCDVGLPGKDGYEVLQAIQRLPGGGEMPFIFLTARADRVDQRRGMVLGADDYITKPFTQRDLLEAIAARIARQRTLRGRVEELIEKRRREISADWSHELMTPLVGVLGGLELIEMEGTNVSPAEFKELLGIIRGGAERQQRLSRKLVRYFELERMRDASPPPGSYQCNAETAVSAGAARAAQEEKRQEDLRLDCERGEVALPETYLIDAVAELVENAFRFSGSGQPVVVSGRCVGREYRIEVQDRGVGMTQAQREKVAPFTQFERTRREQQGLGLGLAIAQLTAGLAGGRLTLAEGEAGRGVKVVVELPLVDGG